MPDDAVQIAYAAYEHHMNQHNWYMGGRLLHWEELPRAHREAWQCAIQAQAAPTPAEDTSPIRPPLTIEGTLSLTTDDEGTPALDINGQFLTVLLAAHCGTCTCCDLVVGSVRLTITFLEEAPHG